MSVAEPTTAQVAARALRNAVADFNAETLSISAVDRLRANVLYVAGKLDGALTEPGEGKTAQWETSVPGTDGAPESLANGTGHIRSASPGSVSAPYDDATALHSVRVLPLRAVEGGEPA